MSESDRYEAQMHPLRIDVTTYYGLQRPAKAYPEPPALLLGLHGYGQTCKRFIRDFAPLRDSNVLVLAPQAPSVFYFRHDPPAIGASWLTKFEKENAIDDFLRYMRRLLQYIYEAEDFDPERVFMLGFSQGVAMAYRLASHGELQPAGVIACGGDLPPDVVPLLEQRAPFPVLLVHGHDDPLVTFDKAQAAERELRRMDYPITTHFFEGGHLLGPPEIDAISTWIKSTAK